MNKLLPCLCVIFLMFGSITNIQANKIINNLLVNGSFDAGPGIPWIEYSSEGWGIICPNSVAPVTPHSGTYLAWLGGDNNLNDYLYQDIVIPKNATDLTINLYRYFSTQETSGTHDHVTLSLRNPTTNQVLETLLTWSNLDSTSGWVRQSVPISASYAGLPVRVFLSSSTDSLLNTNFFFDTISLNATIKIGSISSAFLLLLD
jgi:hypothetical protein